MNLDFVLDVEKDLAHGEQPDGHRDEVDAVHELHIPEGQPAGARHDVGADGIRGVVAIMVGQHDIRGEFRFALAVHVGAVRIPEFPADMLRFPPRHDMLAVHADFSVSIVSRLIYHVAADIDVYRFLFLRLHIHHEKELVPDAVLVNVVKL